MCPLRFGVGEEDEDEDDEERRRRAALIKSSNRHLAGGEQIDPYSFAATKDVQETSCQV